MKVVVYIAAHYTGRVVEFNVNVCTAMERVKYLVETSLAHYDHIRYGCNKMPHTIVCVHVETEKKDYKIGFGQIRILLYCALVMIVVIPLMGGNTARR